MIKRILDISQGPTYLSVTDDQLVLRRDKAEIARVPCEDVGLLLVDHRATTYSHSALTRLAGKGAVVVLCGDDHLPAAMLLAVEGNSLLSQRLRAQVNCARPLRKRLWKQIVTQKICGQAANLPEANPVCERLLMLAGQVKSGDTTNCEGQAGRLYWPALLGKDFRRDREGEWPNALLNYGYMVMRAAVARAICAGGLNPALGLHHSNRSNAFCLADDLVEVLRPAVDAQVMKLLGDGVRSIDRPAKTILLGMLSEEVTVAGQAGPLMVGLHRVVASLVHCYEGSQQWLDLPE